MFEIVFYEDQFGVSDVEGFINDLANRAPTSKDARKLDQIEYALDRLEGKAQTPDTTSSIS